MKFRGDCEVNEGGHTRQKGGVEEISPRCFYRRITRRLQSPSCEKINLILRGRGCDVSSWVFSGSQKGLLCVETSGGVSCICMLAMVDQLGVAVGISSE